MNIPSGMKLRHLEAFLSVAEAGTITGAAKARNVSQPALSKTISELEAQLGTALFERTGRRAVLTPAGEAFRRHTLSSLQSLEAGVRAITGVGQTDVVRVGVLPTVASGLFPSVALEFSELRPDARIAVITGPNRYLIDRMRSGGLDLVVGRMAPAREMAGLSFEYLYDETVILIGRAGHPGLSMTPVEALRRYPLILPNPGSIIRQQVMQYLIASGIEESVSVRFETVARPVGLPLIERSDMLWFISRGVVARELDEGRLAQFDLGVDYMTGAVGLTRKFDFTRDSPADFLAGLLHQRAKDMSAR
ncbi:LysR substrate-binding domain-containing protein [Celeribacter litoreus]|uniref:LysR substrate-binding domain-containing protein n=1 Tax=Celeribacter litoreus TaxID=2876714 RepID=UPI001CCBA012|nr:LysR substrate-binding domain-containing protein [Celeribacter litoreus]MCA0043180.1 LysR family transcriptional regulator [Celeribacter litoreus]